jgi:hypothetical protein
VAKKHYAIRAIVFQEGDWLSAQCLEYDIATQAKTLDDLSYELQRIIVGHFTISRRLGKEPFEGIPKAPDKYWKMFERSKIPLPQPKLFFKATSTPGIKIPRPELRVAPIAA